MILMRFTVNIVERNCRSFVGCSSPVLLLLVDDYPLIKVTPHFQCQAAMSPVLERAKETLLIEIKGVEELVDRLDHNFEKAIDLLFSCKGKVIVTGMGKSGLIGQKISATLTSTGTPSLFLHPAESVHGDLGVIAPSDIVVAISYSGETAEVVQMLGHIHAVGAPLISITGHPESTLARTCSVHLNISVEKEACPLGLAPTTSTTVTLALGDALAMCLLELRQFREEDFAVFHPGGSLGKKLTVTVGDLMVSEPHLPLVLEQTLMREAIHELSDKLLGVVVVTNTEGELVGVFSVGDLMRLIEQKQSRFLDQPVSEFMTRTPKVVAPNSLAAKALYLMETHAITCLIVTSAANKPVGVVQIYSILKAGIY